MRRIDNELTKPKHERRALPNLKELVEAAGVTKGTITRLADGQIQALSLGVGAGIIRQLRAKGFTESEYSKYVGIPRDLTHDAQKFPNQIR